MKRKLEKKFTGLCLICLMLVTGCTAMRAELSLNQGKYDQAAALFQEIILKSPDNLRARSRLGFAYLKVNRIDKAIEEFKTVLKAEPGEPYSTLYLGLAYINRGDYSNALRTWEGYKDKDMPVVEAQIRRLRTMVMMVYSQQEAKHALANEKTLGAAALDNSTIAVTYFRDLSSDQSLKPFQKALAAMVTTDLSKVKSLKVVERTRLQALFDEMKLAQTGIVDKKTAARMGRLLKAENVVAGSIALGSYDVVVSRASSSTGIVKNTSSFKVPRERFYELSGAIIKSLAKGLGVILSSSEMADIGIIHTKSLKAFEYYGSALAELDKGHWEKAQNFFTKALTEDPQFDLAIKGSNSAPDPSAPSINDVGQQDFYAAISNGVESSILAQTKATAAAEAAEAAEEASSGGGGGGH